MNSSPALGNEKVPVTTADTATLYRTSAVPSLMRLSPSRIVTMRRSQAPCDGRRRHGVGRRDDRPQYERRRPRKADHQMRHQGDGEGSEQYEADGQRCYRSQVCLEVAWGGEKGRRVEERREENQEDQIRR